MKNSKGNFHDQLPFYVSSGKAHENGSLNENRYGYGWFEEDQLTNVAMIRHSPSGAGKMNHLQHDKLNAPVSAAQITAEQATGKSKGDSENIFLVIVPVTIGIVIAIILFSLINYLKKMPDIPDLTDQCLIVQQIKPSEVNKSALNEQEEEQNPQNLITNPFEDLNIEDVLSSTLKLANAPACSSQATASNHTNTIAQLNEIYHPVVKGPHTHSHLLIKPASNACYSKETNYLADEQSMNCESKQPKHNLLSYNLSTFYLNNKAQLDYEQTTFATQNWPVNCCETCPCNQQTHPHRAPD